MGIRPATMTGTALVCSSVMPSLEWPFLLCQCWMPANKKPCFPDSLGGSGSRWKLDSANPMPFFAICCWQHARNIRFSAAAFWCLFSSSAMPRNSCSGINNGGSFRRPCLVLWPVLLNSVGSVVGTAPWQGVLYDPGSHSWKPTQCPPPAHRMML